MSQNITLTCAGPEISYNAK